jgi:hypothetical protein
LALVGQLTSLASSWVNEIGLVEPSELTEFRVRRIEEKWVSPGRPAIKARAGAGLKLGEQVGVWME